MLGSNKQKALLTAVALPMTLTGGVMAAGAVQKPVMGYNSYNQVACSPNETQITAAINGMADKGFLDLGYKYFSIDCGWASRDGKRNSTTGSLAYNLEAFPGGLEGLSALARSKGFKWTMYSDAGVRMCDTTSPSPILGSLGHEEADAKLFASLNAEYVKYDNCYADGPMASQNAPKRPRLDFVSRYGAMTKALWDVGIYSMLVCEWGTPYTPSYGVTLGPNAWTGNLSTSFRLSDDISDNWNAVTRIYNQAIHVAKSGLIKPGHHADADLLEVGNPGLTVDEQKTHFAAWAMLKSALFISTDVNALSADAMAILSNKGLIAINQDDLGQPINLVQRWTNDRDVWLGNLANADKAVLVTDLSNSSRSLSVDFTSSFGIASATVLDLWTNKSTSNVHNYSASVGAHGNLALRLSNIQYASADTTKYNYYSFSSGDIFGEAQPSPCDGCLSNSKSKVSYIGGPSNGTVRLSNITTSQATQTVLFDYVNTVISYLTNTTTNQVFASVAVNDGQPQVVSFPLSGYDGNTDVYRNYKVDLSGFKTGGAQNTLTVSGYNGTWSAEFDRVGIVA